MRLSAECAEAIRTEVLVRMQTTCTNLDAASDLVDTGMLKGATLKTAYMLFSTASEEAEKVVSFYRADKGRPMPEDVRGLLETMLQKQKDVLNDLVLKMALESDQ